MVCWMYYHSMIKAKNVRKHIWLSSTMSFLFASVSNIIYINGLLQANGEEVFGQYINNKLQIFFIILPLIINPSILFITTYLSIVKPQLISFNNANDIFQCINYGPFAIYLCFTLVVFICFLIQNIWIECRCGECMCGYYIVECIKVECNMFIDFCSCIKSTRVDRSSYTVIEEIDI